MAEVHVFIAYIAIKIIAKNFDAILQDLIPIFANLKHSTRFLE